MEYGMDLAALRRVYQDDRSRCLSKRQEYVGWGEHKKSCLWNGERFGREEVGEIDEGERSNETRCVLENKGNNPEGTCWM